MPLVDPFPLLALQNQKHNHRRILRHLTDNHHSASNNNQPLHQDPVNRFTPNLHHPHPTSTTWHRMHILSRDLLTLVRMNTTSLGKDSEQS